MRGKLGQRTGDNALERIIPAHAGQTPTEAITAISDADHPRACGANGFCVEIDGMITGSSPRMRGKQADTVRGIPRMRIIPAHAGQTRVVRPTATGIADHPRACGANQEASLSRNVANGSSPRMRGKHGYIEVPELQRRIIPAHAGQTGR